MKTPSERFHELLDGIGEERLAAIDRTVRDPNYAAREVELRDDPDPFGRDWDWIPGTEGAVSPEARIPGTAMRDARPEGRASGGPTVFSFPPARARPWRRRLLWASGIAASFAAIAVGTWAAFGPRDRAPLREQQIAAWVSHELVRGQDGIGLTAPAGEDDRDKPTLTSGADRPPDARPPALPSIYAPPRVQEQLVVPEMPPSLISGQVTRRPLGTVTEVVRPNSVFYLEFSTAATPTAGTAVVVRAGPGPARLLWDEVSVSPGDGTSFFGPIKMAGGEADYIVVIADRTGTELLTTVAPTLASDGAASPDPNEWRVRLAGALKRAGHEWYGIQLIRVRPHAAKAPAR